ncbi:MAG: aminotransferase class I/II-fold pyridoxal phosphate-dependent enzyme [Alphaproteobacteria bacterium]|nr:aminotransferase class I/II-fold pyridoxal phosphate-dependent enzyme [Alphaproteobacteria bacterium]
MIPVTKPFLPPREEYDRYLDGIWERNWLTNHGPLVKELEDKLCGYLGAPQMQFVSNGTIALQLAIKALDLEGEIITTPFSYVATTTSIIWEGCTPMYVDIDSKTFNIDPLKIEAAITSKTTAILATHVYGNPCDIDAIQAIAKKYGLKVIYDGAHAFGVKYKGRSVFGYGDISTCSFHATKIFHTSEGGGVFTQDSDLHAKIGLLMNFGHAGFDKFNGIGINGKNSEFHAAMGLAVFPFVGQILSKRKAQAEYYDELLAGLPLQKQVLLDPETYNFSYYPILFPNEETLLSVKSDLDTKEVGSRRYFYPSLSSLDYVIGQTPVANDVAARVLCLPVYHSLVKDEQKFIIEILKDSFNK